MLTSLQPNIEGKGACCNEMDIFEANSRASNIASHPCNQTGFFACSGDDCGKQGSCDKIGCTYNPYKLGTKDSYGRGDDFSLDTTRPFTVISQFPTDHRGALKSYRRTYMQDGNFIPMGEVRLDKFDDDINYLTEDLCEAQDADKYLDLGGHKAMGDAMARGMVLAMSIWWDENDNLIWLDGNESGPCRKGEGSPENIRSKFPGTEITFSNIRWGEIGSTFLNPYYGLGSASDIYAAAGGSASTANSHADDAAKATLAGALVGANNSSPSSSSSSSSQATRRHERRWTLEEGGHDLFRHRFKKVNGKYM